MEELSLLEKFKILFDNIIQHPLFIILLLVPGIIFLLQKKHGKKAFVFVYLLVLIFVLYIGGEVIFELFDNLMDGLFMTLYFPNFITLFVVVVACSIIALISFFSKKMFRVNKIINITGFAIIQMLFVLILTLVRSKNINIYADNALYSNSDVLTLMQLLIGTFALQVIAVLIISAINKVTNILDGRSELAEDISQQISELSKTKNNLGLKSVEIDNKKIGYINVADKSKTSKPKLKPFQFDMDKLEAITLNVPNEANAIIIDDVSDAHAKEEVTKEDVSFNEGLEEKKVEGEKVQAFNFKEKLNDLGKKKKNSFNKIKKPKKSKKVLLPVEKSEPAFNKPNLLEPMKEAITIESDVSTKIENKGSKFINESLEKPDLLAPTPLKVLSEVEKPKLVHPNNEVKPVDLVDNLNILDIQSTLDTVIRYRLMRGVSLKVVKDEAAVSDLQIPDFNHMMKVLGRCKLYKKI